MKTFERTGRTHWEATQIQARHELELGVQTFSQILTGLLLISHQLKADNHPDSTEKVAYFMQSNIPLVPGLQIVSNTIWKIHK